MNDSTRAANQVVRLTSWRDCPLDPKCDSPCPRHVSSFNTEHTERLSDLSVEALEVRRSRQSQKLEAGFHARPFDDVDPLHAARTRRAKLVLHFHGLDHDESRTGVHLLVF